MENSNENITERNYSIDFIKIIATTMVLALHLWVSRSHYGSAESNFVTSLSGIAIPLFFLVSGYLMAGKRAQISYALKKSYNTIKVPFIICSLFDVVILIRHGFFQFDFPLCLVQKGDWWHFWYFGSMAIIYLVLPLLEKIIHGKNLNVAIVILFIISITFWILDICIGFEKKYVCQTFRLWYFLMYFLIGVKISLSSKTKRVTLGALISSAMLYSLSTKVINAGGVEYNFGSPFCVLYTVSLFIICLNVDLDKYSNSYILKAAKNAILPTYIFHLLILNKLTMIYVHPIMEKMQFFNLGGFLIEWLFTALTAFVFSIILSSIPLFNKIIKL